MRHRARFSKKSGDGRLSVYDGIKRIEHELGLFNAKDVVISSNLDLRLDGVPRSNQKQPNDPGVAVYFVWGKARRVFACDQWDRVEHNMAAIAAHVHALRAIARHGVGTREQILRGYNALPPPSNHDGSPPAQWRDVLELPQGCNWGDVTAAYGRAVRAAHPDHGGDSERLAEVMAAYQRARAEFGKP